MDNEVICFIVGLYIDKEVMDDSMYKIPLETPNQQKNIAILTIAVDSSNRGQRIRRSLLNEF